MRGLTLAVCLFALFAAALCSPDSSPDSHQNPHHGHPYGHGNGYYYNKRQYCPLKSYTQTVTKKFLYGEHWEVCTGVAIRYRCDGYCAYQNYPGGYYYGGKGYYGANNRGFFGRNGYYPGYGGYYNGYYGRKSCCRSAYYGQKRQDVKFHCGHYGYKVYSWQTKEPTKCNCSYYC